MNTSTLVQKVWNFCHTLRDDGVGYGDYLEQLTYLLFLKLAHEYAQEPYMRAEKERLNRDEIFAEYWSRFETDFWSAEVKRGGRSYSRLDLGLRFFLMAKTGQMVDARRVNEEYKRWISITPPRYATVKDELADFTRYGDAYQRYESVVPMALPSTDLRRVLMDFDVSTALPLVLFLELEASLDAGQLKQCQVAIESFLARRILIGEETKEYNKFFVEVIGALRGLQGQEVFPALQIKLLAGGGSTRHWPSDIQVIEAAVSRAVFQQIKTPALRLILERFELYFRSKKSESNEVSQGLQIEHVLPQKWATYWPLGGKSIPANVVEYPFLAKDELLGLADDIRGRNSSLQTLGNLTLLNKYLNPAASNGSFEMKMLEYKNSVLRLNRYFDATSAWDESSIKIRGKLLGEAFCKIWPRADF